MRPHDIGGLKRVPRKRRLAGALAGFGAGHDPVWRLVWCGLKILELPEKIKPGPHRPSPPAALPAHHRHEHL